jgi:hypothetical protein
MAGGGTPENTRQTTTTELPWWLDQAAQEQWANAQKIGAQGYQGYEDPRLAPFSGDQQQAQQQIRAMQGQTGDTLGHLRDFNQQNLGFTPQQVQAGSIPNTNLDAYMNPCNGSNRARSARSTASVGRR